MLRPGDQAPRFSLPDADLEPVDLEQYIGNSHVVLYFYPKDDTRSTTLSPRGTPPGFWSWCGGCKFPNTNSRPA